VDELRAINMLEHLHEVQVLLDEIVRVCKPGAPIFLVVPDVQHERFHIPMHCQPWSRHWWEHDAPAYFDVLSIVEIPDPGALAVARKYLPTITDADAMLLLWNCRYELHIHGKAR
jgi:ubiquinone/menaquinone biosynthesis C-methylase UbiE